MAAFNKFHVFVDNICDKIHNLSSDTLKVMLTNVAPVATNTQKSNITQIANGNGYVTDGATVTTVSSSQTSGLYKLIINDVVFTASGGSIGPFRWAVLMNSTPAAGALIGYWDYGSSITLAAGETFTVDFSATNGVIQLS